MISTKYKNDGIDAYMAERRAINARIVRNCLKARALETKDPRLMTALLVVAGADDEVLDAIMRGLK